jgi:hypothetical protein
MRRALLISALVAAVLTPTAAQANYHPKKPEPWAKMTLNEKHRFLHKLKGHSWAVVKHGRRAADRRWHRKALVRINARLDEVHAAIARERREQALRRQREYIDSCLMEIIRREASGFDPGDPSTWHSAATKWNGQGSGAYGVPQALPGHKMASAGRDWATNPWTQIRWMKGYVNGRYGGSCQALAYWNSHGHY